MRLPEPTIEATERAREEAFRLVRAVPEDRLEGRSLGVGRSVLRIARELSKTPGRTLWVLTDAKPDDPEGAAAGEGAGREDGRRRRGGPRWNFTDHAQIVPFRPARATGKGPKRPLAFDGSIGDNTRRSST